MRDVELPADLTRLKGVSAEGVALVGAMLHKDFAARPTAKAVSAHGWFAKVASAEGYFASGASEPPSLPAAELDARARRYLRTGSDPRRAARR